MTNLWIYRGTSGRLAGTDLTDYKVEALDGGIGKVDKHSDEVDSSYLVVDTGPWIFGKHVLLPAGTVKRVDMAEHKIHVGLTKDEIKAAPEFDRERHLGDADYQRVLDGYYGGMTHRA
ncbi:MULTISPECIES: PRC-barrel domain containing protein [unclassified Streptomyces]|uniref:PRC-barrel domain containing protein n=1 Tax=unclassified Streptomyces TaxID=2593676 RepID=UPI002E15DB74|nr:MULTISPECIES: PRC-barrel domain containing protein [unclassified Streptomyces]WSR23055.1 PRC-barrel domain containing protein [Streptomyces sp. NBC_01205]